MKAIKLLTIITILSASVQMNATEPTVTMKWTFSDTTFVGAQTEAKWAKYCQELADYDVYLLLPEGFSSVDMRGRDDIAANINPAFNAGGKLATETARIGLENENSEALMLYPFIFYGNSEWLLRNAHCISEEIRGSLKDENVDVMPYINIISKEDMSQYANADTVITYDIKFASPVFGCYRDGVGVYLRKANHPALNLKIALSKEALKDKEKYLRILFDNIRYGNNPAKELIEAEERTKALTDYIQLPKKTDDLSN